MFLIITLFILGIITFIGLGFIPRKGISRGYHKNLYQLFSLVWILFILFGCITSVGANQVGIVYDQLNGGVQEKTIGEGLKIKTPFQKIIKISTSNRNKRVVTAAQTKDSIYADFEITVIYRISPQNAGLFFRTTNDADINQDNFNATLKESLQRNTTKFDIYGVMGEELDALRNAFQEDFSKSMLEKFYVTVVSVSIDDVDAGARIEEIIRTKAEAMQNIEIEEKKKEQALIEAERLLIEAKAKADAKVEEAKGDAAAIEQIAKAEAEATKQKLQEVMIALGVEINDEGVAVGLTIEELKVITDYMKYLEYLATWNGELPQVITDGNGIILDFSK